MKILQGNGKLGDGRSSFFWVFFYIVQVRISSIATNVTYSSSQLAFSLLASAQRTFPSLKEAPDSSPASLPPPTLSLIPPLLSHSKHPGGYQFPAHTNSYVILEPHFPHSVLQHWDSRSLPFCLNSFLQLLIF